LVKAVAEPLYKFLTAGAVGPFSGSQWPAPEEGRPSDWLDADGPLEPCRTGIHVCRPADLPYWMNEELYEVEVDGDRIDEVQKIVVQRARLLSRVEAWPGIAWALAEDCVWRLRRATVRELELAGRPEAEELLAQDDLRAVGDAAARVAEAPADRTARAAMFLGFLTDAAGYALEARDDPTVAATTVGYVAAHAADRATPDADKRLPPGVSPFELEREQQAAFLAGALGRG
jgi:hypothetical protein